MPDETDPAAVAASIPSEVAEAPPEDAPKEDVHLPDAEVGPRHQTRMYRVEIKGKPCCMVRTTDPTDAKARAVAALRMDASRTFAVVSPVE